MAFTDNSCKCDGDMNKQRRKLDFWQHPKRAVRTTRNKTKPFSRDCKK